MPVVNLTDKECALIYKAIDASDWSYIGETATAENVKRKVLPGARAHSSIQKIRQEPDHLKGKEK